MTEKFDPKVDIVEAGRSKEQLERKFQLPDAQELLMAVLQAEGDMLSKHGAILANDNCAVHGIYQENGQEKLMNIVDFRAAALEDTNGGAHRLILLEAQPIREEDKGVKTLTFNGLRHLLEAVLSLDDDTPLENVQVAMELAESDQKLAPYMQGSFEMPAADEKVMVVNIEGLSTGRDEQDGLYHVFLHV